MAARFSLQPTVRALRLLFARTLACASAASAAFGTHAIAGTNEWTTIDPDGGYADEIVFHPSDPDVAYLIDPAALFVTHDGGTTWKPLDALATSLEPTDLVLEVPYPPSTVRITSKSGFALTLRNASAHPATGAQVAIQIPSIATDVVARVWGDAVGTCAVATGLATCTIDVLTAGTTANIDVSMNLLAIDEYPVSASATSDQPDPVTANNAVSLTLRVAAPAAATAPPSRGGGGGGVSLLWVITTLLLAVARMRSSDRERRTRYQVSA